MAAVVMRYVAIVKRQRRPLASLRKQHRKGKRMVSQREAHRANLRREFREER